MVYYILEINSWFKEFNGFRFLPKELQYGSGPVTITVNSIRYCIE